MQRLNQFFIRLQKDSHGAVFILVAAGLTALIASVAIAIELSHYTQTKAKVRNALDQALLAAAATSNDDATLQNTMLEYFKANLGNTLTDVDIVALNITRFENPTRWSARTAVNIKAEFSGIVGLSNFTLTHEAGVAWDETTTNELVAMVDMSGTMCANFGRQTGVNTAFIPDRNCTKLRDMRDALTRIVNIGVGVGVDNAVFKVGLVPFTFKVRMANPAAIPSVAPFLLAGETDAAAIAANNNPPIIGDPNYFTNVSDSEPNGVRLPDIIPLTSIRSSADKKNFTNAVNNLVSSDTANNEFLRLFVKRSSLGAQISAMMLDPRYTSLFGGEPPAPFGSNKVNKTVIMMTDSANLGCCYTNWPEGNFRNNYIYSYKPDHEHLVGPGGNGEGICKQMKDAGITVYTVLLDVDETDLTARGREIIDSYEQCATSPAHAFRVGFGDKEALANAYQQVGAALKNLKLTY